MKMVKKNAVLLCWWWAQQQQQQQQHSVVGFIFSASTAPLSCNLLFTSPQTTLPTPNDDPIFYASDWLFNKSPFSDFEVVVVVVLRESVTERRPALHLHRAELQGHVPINFFCIIEKGSRTHNPTTPFITLCLCVCVWPSFLSHSKEESGNTHSHRAWNGTVLALPDARTTSKGGWTHAPGRCLFCRQSSRWLMPKSCPSFWWSWCYLVELRVFPDLDLSIAASLHMLQNLILQWFIDRVDILSNI